MMISPVSFRAAATQAGTNQNTRQEEKNSIKAPKFTPVQKATFNGVAWGIFGYAIDRVMNMLPGNLFKTSTKQSILINTGIGLATGVLSYFKIKKTQSEKETAPAK